MRLLLIISALESGGAESHVISLALQLAAGGNKVFVASAGGALVSTLEERGISHTKIYTDKWRLLWSIPRIYRLIKKEKIQIIHSHTRPTNLMGTLLSLALKIPLVTTVHASFSTVGLYRLLSFWGNCCIAVSEDLRQYVCKQYKISPQSTYLIENGIDTEVFYPRHYKNGVRIVFASRLDGDCSLLANMLCELIRELKERFGAELHICGGGNALPRLRQKYGDKVFFHGNVRNMAEILSSATAFVGVSRCALEAMACGVPVILGGNEGYYGFVENAEALSSLSLENFCCRDMPSASKERLRNDLFHVLSLSANERQALGKELSSYISRHNSACLMARRTEEAYRQLLPAEKKPLGRILLCGYYGFGNIGDNALLRASAELAKKKFKGWEISALTKKPHKDKQSFRLRCINRFSPIRVFWEIYKADILVFGGGTLLQERTSLRSLLYYTALIAMAKTCNTQVQLWGNGIGTPTSPLGSRLMKWALEYCEFIGLRDSRSLYEAKELLGSTDKLYFQPDLAASQPSAPKTRLMYLSRLYKIDRKNAPCGYAVISVKGSERQGFKQILKDRLLELRLEGLRLLFIPMHPKEDTAESIRLCKDYGGVLARGLSEGDVAALIRQSEVVLSMRLHALIFATGITPFVGFGGDPKIEDYCRQNGGVYFTDLY